MPHTPATHLTITPKHVYINGEPICVMKDTLELSNPSPVEVQTVTLTIFPTSVTILNDDNTDEINAAHKAHTRRMRDETANADQNVYQVNWTSEAYDAWKRHESALAKHTHARH